MSNLNPAIMTEDQRECYALLCDWAHGAHHLYGNVKEFGQGIIINARNTNLATFDFDCLTRLVFLAHDRCMRVEIIPSGPGLIGITVFKRRTREGDISRRHPTIEAALATWRKRHPAPETAP